MSWILNEYENYVFHHPFTCYIAGPTSSGKTVLLQKILLNKNILFDKIPNRIVFCYKIWQPAYEIFKLLDNHLVGQLLKSL